MYTSMKVYKQILILENLKTSVCPIHLLKFAQEYPGAGGEDPERNTLEEVLHPQD